MLDNETINRMIGIDEAYKIPEKLLSLLMDDKTREKLFDEFLQHEQDLSFDWFTSYFQNEHGDRKNLKQDFTPNCVTEIISELMPQSDCVCDICAGTGGLTIKAWSKGKGKYYYCEEISERTVPMLLFNLAIRNISGTVVNGNSLTKENKHIYKLDGGERFSTITEIDCAPNIKFKSVISNPPYSLKWEPVNDERFEKYGIAPKSKADYAFLLHGLYKLEDGGTMLAILPHGVLFRGRAEGEIRRHLIEDNVLDAVVGLPDKLFENTGIPVCVLVLKKARQNRDVLFIDASRDFDAVGKINVMNENHMQRVVIAYKNRSIEDRYADIISFEQIAANDFNLNIPRYVNTFEPEPEPLPDLCQALTELNNISDEITKAETDLCKMLKALTGFTADEQNAVNKWCERMSI